MRTRLTAILVLVLLGLGSMPALAQPGGTVEVTSIAVVLENPRGDSVVLGTVEPGTVAVSSESSREDLDVAPD